MRFKLLCLVAAVFTGFSVFALTAVERAQVDPFITSMGFQFVGPDSNFGAHNGDSETVEFLREAANGRSAIGEVRYRFYKGCRSNYFSFLRSCKNTRPLVIFFPGLGGGIAEAPTLAFAEILADKYHTHTLALPSIGSRQYIKTTSGDGYSGYLPRDTRTIYSATKAAIADLQKDGYRFSKIYLMGYSMGALQAAFLGNLDKEAAEIGVQGTILMNPPVDLQHGLNVLDRAFKTIFRLRPENRQRFQRDIERRSMHLIFSANDGKYSSPQEALVDAARILPVHYARYLIGLIFHQSLYSFREGAVPAGETMTLPESIVSSGLFRVTNDSYNSYFRETLLPFLQQNENPQLTSELANAKSSLTAVESFLGTESTFLVHNADDFLLRSGDVELLSSIMGERLKIFPFGGHLGNMGMSQYQDAVFSFYEGLLTTDEVALTMER